MNEDFFTGAQQKPVYASARATDFRMPNPDPEEKFDHMTYQLFGPNNPAPNALHQMKGFFLDYERVTKEPGINVDGVLCNRSSSGDFCAGSRLRGL
jgi:hypothetical protein